MAKRGRKTGKAVDDKGYLDKNKGNFTDYKVISGNKITMEGVSGNIYAIPIDKAGKAGEGRLLKSGENHEFEGAAHVIEVPELAMAKLGLNTDPTDPPYKVHSNQSDYGGFGSSILNGIQGAGNAVANQFEKARYEDGNMLNTFEGYLGTATDWFKGLGSNENEGQVAQNEAAPVVAPTPESYQPVNTLAEHETYAQGYEDRQQSHEELTKGVPNSYIPVNSKAEHEAELMADENRQKSLAELTEGVPKVDGEEKWNKEDMGLKNPVKPTERIQFHNQYGGVDIPTAAQTLGASFSYDGEKTGANAMRGIASGAKLLAGIGRNIASGYGQNKRNQYVLDEYNREQKKATVGNTIELKKGGEVTSADLLAGAYTTGNPTEAPNVEVEGGEHIMDNQTGQVQEVVGKKHSEGGEKMNLEDHKVLTDFTKIGAEKAKAYKEEYGINIKAKDTFSTVMDRVLKKTGYTSITEELTQAIETTEKEKERTKGKKEDEATEGINMQHLSGKINDLSNSLKPLEEVKATVFERLYNDQQGDKSSEEIAQEKMKEGGLVRAEDGVDTGDTSFNKDESRKRFSDFVKTAKALGYRGDVDENAENLDAEAAKLQKYMVENHPKIAAEYAKKNRITHKGLERLKSEFPYIFEQAGLDINKKSPDFSDEELTKLSEVATELDVVDDSFWLDQFNDGLWRYRAPNAATKVHGATAKNTPLSGAAGVKDITTQLLQTPTEVTEPSAEAPTVVSETPEAKAEKEKREATGDQTLMLPNQYIMPPSSMQPHRLSEITPREAEAKLISPDTQIEEINRQFLSAKTAIDSLPDSQRRAALAQLNTQTQQSINQVMAQTNRDNAQIEGRVEEGNIGRQGLADQFNERGADEYERKTLVAKDNTENEIRSYFNAQNKANIANYNTVQNINLSNAMYDNFQYTGDGRIKQTGTGLDSDMMAKIAAYNLAVTAAKEDEKKKTTKKKDTTPNMETNVRTGKRGRSTK